MKLSILKHAAAPIAAILFGSASALACPDPSQTGQQFTFTGDDLWTAQSLPVTAGGTVDLGNCSSMPGVGYVITRPDFSINYNERGRFNLRFKSNASCDTILLINDATGQWHWDDDGGDGLGGLIWLNDAASGKIDVWVGTYGTDTCTANLEVESFR